MNFQQLRIVRETVKQNFNLTEVANALYTSQSGVSRNIKELEEELGLLLYVRKGKRLLGMTKPGEDLLVMAEKILNEAANIKRLAQNFAQPKVGKLVIATTHTQARYALPEVIKEFRVHYPLVKLVIYQGSPKDILTMVQNGEADIGIASELLAENGGIATFEYYQWHHRVIAPSNHPLADEENLTLEQLVQWPLITYHRGLTGRSNIDRAFATQEQQPEIVLSAQDSDVIKTYVSLGMGVGIIAEKAIHSDEDSSLVRIDASHLFATNTVWLGVKSHKLQPDYTHFFLNLCNPSLSLDEIHSEIYRDKSALNYAGFNYQI
ncbi:LysR substrate-binding domain-containing protein [Vibrio cholerae]|uniref:LysR substrate-binding domain-containing protein n=1 Tax=Vibrio TaxID=662 RepID=UPI00186A8FC6|nr:LysR substrate-binding domain-containing protein [Vibrio navarrensis]MBE4589951.1 transcriptional regulator Cbl [Vibrio navarrensis]MCG6226881.1 LysR substrate-binding domain-containing protein [Vibrio furnissii]